MLKKSVKYSLFSWILTIGVVLLLLAGVIIKSDNTRDLAILTVILVGLCLSYLFYSPFEVEADKNELKVRRHLKNNILPIEDIESVEYFVPILFGNIRLCGSGGFGGYWGWFNDSSIGTYFAYFGKREECFHVKMKNGRSYVIGCEDCFEMISYLKGAIEEKKS